MAGGVVVLQFLLILLWALWLATTSASNSPIAIPGCNDTCGNISVPYPFGFGDRKCYRQGFNLTCNGTGQLFTETLEVIDISYLQGQMRVYTSVLKNCNGTSYQETSQPSIEMKAPTPYMFSSKENLFTAVGCDDEASITSLNADYSPGAEFSDIGCRMNLPFTGLLMTNGSCTGICCCQTSIPEGTDGFVIQLSSANNHTDVYDINPCGYAFLVDKNWYTFSTLDLTNFTNTVPTVLEWAINWPTQAQYPHSCEEAMNDPTTYACGNNSVCVFENEGGYSCNCSYGYQGNPYLEDGCQEVDECLDNHTTCVHSSLCHNLLGTYNCSCPHGYHGDGMKNGTGCNPTPISVVQVTLGTGFGFLFLLTGSLLVLWAFQKRKLSKLKERYFKENGGLLLRQQLSSYDNSTESAKIFTAEELNKATNNYAESRILGRGGYGTVYKGILSNNRIVAIKKSKLVDESQIEQFINEVVILSQINHRNVVKLLGCCLETQVPLLVYEFVTNNTLYHHIHDEGCKSSISWDNRLRIATETAESLAYLHSAASPPIIHRDIKSANILLDDNYTAKVSDFGASRLIPIDKSQLSTLVQGTMGYLDPEYFHSSQLTEKSDVYSFGVVLVELLTGKTALSFARPENERNLAMHFITSMNENTVWDILENRVLQEGSKEQIQEVMELARRCLRLKGEERPKMKEVAAVLESLRRHEKHPWASQSHEEVEYLLHDESLIELRSPNNTSERLRGPMTI